MITCTLGEKKYTVDFVSGRALREMEPASKMYGRLVRLSQDATEGKDVSQEQLTVTDALDTMVKWFCILFNNQFTPDEVYDNYPADRLMHDIALALMAVQTQTTEVLDTFPTIPAASGFLRNRHFRILRLRQNLLRFLHRRNRRESVQHLRGLGGHQRQRDVMHQPVGEIEVLAHTNVYYRIHPPKKQISQTCP